MRTHKLLFTLVSLILTVMFIVGCGGGGNETAETPATAAPPTVEVTQEVISQPPEEVTQEEGVESPVEATQEAIIEATEEISTEPAEEMSESNGEDSMTAEEYLQAGIASYEIEDAEVALADLDQAIELDPELAEAYYYRGQVYYELMENYEAALADYDQTIELAPEMVKAYIGRGKAAGRNEDYEAAQADFEKALELNPESAEAHVGLGDVSGQADELETALFHFEEAVALNPELPEAYLGLGMVHWRQEDYEAALLALDQAIELDPELANAYAIRGFVHQTMDESEMALADLETYLELDPEGEGTEFVQQTIDELLAEEDDTVLGKGEGTIEVEKGDDLSNDTEESTLDDRDDIVSVIGGDEIPAYPDLEPLTEENPEAFIMEMIVDQMRQSAENEETDVDIDIEVYSLPKGTTYEEIKTFYDDALNELDWEQVQEEVDEAQGLSMVGWEKDDEQGFAIMYIPSSMQEDVAYLLIVQGVGEIN